MNIKLLQTSDQDRYRAMLDISAAASRRFCEIQDIDYVQFIGIKRGCHPWHATFNRIVMLYDLLRDGYQGWAIYLDADAYPYDVRFAVRDYLAENREWAIIGARGGAGAHTVNAGILLFNLAQARARKVIERWHLGFQRALSDEALRGDPDWTGINDQDLLHVLLAERGDAEQLVKIESFDLIGWPKSRFLRQHLREFGSFDMRCAQMREGVEEALREIPGAARLIASFMGR